MARQGSSNPVLYTYFRSSCSARIRIACYWKGINLDYEYINLLQAEQFKEDYKAINPCVTVPTLVIPSSSPFNNTGFTIVLRQSVAILEFLEEYEGFARLPKLLPDDAIAKAKVRELVNIICNDIQPVSNQHVLKRVKSLNADSASWAAAVISRGLEAYEALLGECAGQYSFGDEITMADVCLAPTVEAALRWGVKMNDFPLTWGIYERLRTLDCFVRGDWKHQEDTPEEFRS